MRYLFLALDMPEIDISGHAKKPMLFFGANLLSNQKIHRILGPRKLSNFLDP